MGASYDEASEVGRKRPHRLRMPLYGRSLQDLSYSGGVGGPEEPMGASWDGASKIGGKRPPHAENASV